MGFNTSRSYAVPYLLIAEMLNGPQCFLQDHFLMRGCQGSWVRGGEDS